MKVKGVLLDVRAPRGSVSVIDLEEDDLEEFYEALNCNTIDITTRGVGDRKFVIVCDDEGLLQENPTISAIGPDGKFTFVGNLFICNRYKEHLASLSVDDINHILKNVIVISMAQYKTSETHTFPVLTNVQYV